jgi:hypothetical protein
MDESYDEEFVKNNPFFRGYTKNNCLLLQTQEMLTSVFNCTLVYFQNLNNTPYCSPLENIAMWNPDLSTLHRHDSYHLIKATDQIYCVPLLPDINANEYFL